MNEYIVKMEAIVIADEPPNLMDLVEGKVEFEAEIWSIEEEASVEEYWSSERGKQALAEGWDHS